MSSAWETLREVPRLQEKTAWRMQAMPCPFSFIRWLAWREGLD